MVAPSVMLRKLASKPVTLVPTSSTPELVAAHSRATAPISSEVRFALSTRSRPT
ncbi:MAG: hypothetical protein R3E53_06090 [Myxococcota bacterium]